MRFIVCQVSSKVGGRCSNHGSMPIDLNDRIGYCEGITMILVYFLHHSSNLVDVMKVT